MAHFSSYFLIILVMMGLTWPTSHLQANAYVMLVLNLCIGAAWAWILHWHLDRIWLKIFKLQHGSIPSTVRFPANFLRACSFCGYFCHDIHVFGITDIIKQLVLWIFWIPYSFNRFYKFCTCKVTFFALKDLRKFEKLKKSEILKPSVKTWIFVDSLERHNTWVFENLRLGYPRNPPKEESLGGHSNWSALKMIISRLNDARAQVHLLLSLETQVQATWCPNPYQWYDPRHQIGAET